MNFSTYNRIDQIPAQSWNTLIDSPSPFIQHEFLQALERNQCLGEQFGWWPQHAVLYNDAHQIIGVAPMYLKTNSYGEFVFDGSWADAYRRYGLNYYPKLVIAAPYSPVPGQRLLITNNHNTPQVMQQLIAGILDHAQQINVSSIHCLFGHEFENTQLEKYQFTQRLAYQFHWHNHHYQNFEDFLSHLASKKRKNIKKERRKVFDAGIHFQILHGTDIREEQWAVFHRHYQSTFDRLGGYPTLSKAFFQEIAQTMKDQVILVAAYDGQQHIASAFCLRDNSTLYGRHWGCDKLYQNLHFEACYYQGIEYCIEHGLQRFEPGAQGEHKISRGFLPTATYSEHWIAEPTMKEAIDRFLVEESIGIQKYMHRLEQHSPFKNKKKNKKKNGAS